MALTRFLPFAGLRPRETAQGLERFLARCGPLASGPVRGLLDGAIAFDLRQPIRGLAREDVDLLLFQSGAYDWGGGERFELNLTRQFVASDRDRSISQLRLTLFFAPRSDLRRLGAHQVWRPSRDEAAVFRQTVLKDPATTALGERQALERQVVWGPV